MDKHPFDILVEIFGGRVGVNSKGYPTWIMCFDSYLYECSHVDDPRGQFSRQGVSQRQLPINVLFVTISGKL